MFDVAVARAAGEFLSSELSLDAFSKKYFEVRYNYFHSPSSNIALEKIF